MRSVRHVPRAREYTRLSRFRRTLETSRRRFSFRHCRIRFLLSRFPLSIFANSRIPRESVHDRSLDQTFPVSRTRDPFDRSKLKFRGYAIPQGCNLVCVSTTHRRRSMEHNFHSSEKGEISEQVTSASVSRGEPIRSPGVIGITPGTD